MRFAGVAKPGVRQQSAPAKTLVNVMSGRAPANQGLFFGVALVVGAVMSSACDAEN
jgi:hypothetical protein